MSYHDNLERAEAEGETYARRYPNAAQEWLSRIPVMQQSVLFSAIRGPDNFAKNHPAKGLLKWYRRCVLISAFDGKTLTNPCDPGGGSFTGPSLNVTEFGVLGRSEDGDRGWLPPDEWPLAMQRVVDQFVHSRDEMSLHYYAHAMHAFQIIGYKHPDDTIAKFWRDVYHRMVNALHLFPEDSRELDRRLGDDKGEWSLKADEAGSCSE